MRAVHLKSAHFLHFKVEWYYIITLFQIWGFYWVAYFPDQIHAEISLKLYYECFW